MPEVSQCFGAKNDKSTNLSNLDLTAKQTIQDDFAGLSSEWLNYRKKNQQQMYRSCASPSAEILDDDDISL